MRLLFILVPIILTACTKPQWVHPEHAGLAQELAEKEGKPVSAYDEQIEQAIQIHLAQCELQARQSLGGAPVILSDNTIPPGVSRSAHAGSQMGTSFGAGFAHGMEVGRLRSLCMQSLGYVQE